MIFCSEKMFNLIKLICENKKEFNCKHLPKNEKTKHEHLSVLNNEIIVVKNDYIPEGLYEIVQSTEREELFIKTVLAAL